MAAITLIITISKYLISLTLLTIVVFAGCNNAEQTVDDTINEQPPVVDIKTPSVDDVSTYSSTKHKLSFEHPSDWVVYEAEGSIQPINVTPRDVRPSNYFTIEVSDSFPLAEQSDEAKTTLNIDGETAYLFEGDPSAAGQLLYIRFEHNDMVYSIVTFKEWYDNMPEVQAMIDSLQLN